MARLIGLVEEQKPVEEIIEKTPERLEQEAKAIALGVKGNVAGMKDVTLEKKILELTK